MRHFAMRPYFAIMKHLPSGSQLYSVLVPVCKTTNPVTSQNKCHLILNCSESLCSMLHARCFNQCSFSLACRHVWMISTVEVNMVYIFIVCLLSSVACIAPASPQTTVPDVVVHNETQQQARKSARSFQPSLPTSTSTYSYETAAKKKQSYSYPEQHLGSNLYSGNHAFVYNTFSDKGKYSVYSPPAHAPTDNANKQGKLSSKYSSVTGGLPSAAKIDRRQEDREGMMQDYFTQNSGSLVPNSRHGYGHYDDHGDYGGLGDDDDYDGGNHYSPEFYSHHHHHGHHHHHPIHHYPPPAIYYPAHHEKHEYSKLGILAVVKIVLAKLKALGLVKIILILLAKIPLIFLKIALKFFFLFKAVKLFKLLTFSALFPLILIPLIPLLLLPLLFLPLAPLLLIPLLLPLLLPLILLLPVPVMNGVTTNAKTASSRRRRDANPATGRVWRQLDASHDFLALTQQVLESQQCLERLACKMAAKHDSTTYTNVVLW